MMQGVTSTMFMWLRSRRSVTLFFGMLLSFVASIQAASGETARVCELTLTKFVEGKYDLKLLLYHRDGKFYHGYALLPQRILLGGAERVWTSETVHYPPHRATPIAHRGHFYIDSRITGFSCVEAKSGKLIGQHPHIYEQTGGDHNWTWHLATNGRVITSGVLMFSDAAGGFKRMPGRLSLDLASGYMCPVKPAIADGRLFVRTLDKLVCYDLRKPDKK